MTREILLASMLSPEEKLSLIDDIWSSLPNEAKDWPLTATNSQELERRLEEARQNPGVGHSWEEVEARVLVRLHTK